MRALRLLYRDLPDLPVAGRRARRAARPHLPDQAGARRRTGDAKDAAPPRPLSHLPVLRDDLPVRRPVREARGHRAQDRRGSRRAAARRGGAALVAAQGAHLPRALRRGGRARTAREGTRATRIRAADSFVAGSRRLARAAPRSEGDRARRLRATLDRARDRRRARSRAGPRRRLARSRRRWRMLRGAAVPPQRSGGGADVRAPQHRRVVAGDRAGRRSGRRVRSGGRSPRSSRWTADRSAWRSTRRARCSTG